METLTPTKIYSSFLSFFLFSKTLQESLTLTLPIYNWFQLSFKLVQNNNTHTNKLEVSCLELFHLNHRYIFFVVFVVVVAPIFSPPRCEQGGSVLISPRLSCHLLNLLESSVKILHFLSPLGVARWRPESIRSYLSLLLFLSFVRPITKENKVKLETTKHLGDTEVSRCDSCKLKCWPECLT